LTTAEPRKSNLRTVLLGCAVLAVAFIAVLALAPPSARAAEEPFKIEFEKSSLEFGSGSGSGGLGALSGLLSAVPLGDLGPASIEGTVDDTGKVKIPRGSFKLPIVDVSNLGGSAGLTLPVEIQGFMGIEQAATGTYDPATGKLVIPAKAGLWVSVNVQQLLTLVGGSLPPQLGAITGLLGENLTCGFSPMDVTFTTEPTSLGTGERFTKGLLGPGALTAEWSQLGPFAGKTKILGVIDVCTTIRGLLPSLISGLGGGSGIDLGGLPIADILSGLDSLDLGPTGLTITRTTDNSPPPVDPPAEAEVGMSLDRRVVRVKAGKSARFRISVTNSGGSTASDVSLCARVPKLVTGGGCRSLGLLAAGQKKSRSFRLKVAWKRRARSAKVMFMVRAGGSVVDTTSARITQSSN
jgi:hypothetical protein